MAALAVVKGLKEKRTGAKSDQATPYSYIVLLSNSHIFNLSILLSHHPEFWVPDTIHPIQSSHLDYSATSI